MKSWIFFWNWYVLIPFYLSRHDIFSLCQVFKLSQTPIFLGRNFKNFAVWKMHFSVLKAFFRYKNYWNLKFFFAIKCYKLNMRISQQGTFITIANSFLKVWISRIFNLISFQYVNMLSQRLKRFLEWKLKFWKVEFFFLLCFNPFLSFATWYFFARPSFQTFLSQFF